MKSQTIYSKTAALDEVKSVAKEILKLLPKNAVIFLKGDLAAGKTTFTNAVVEQLGLGTATSPTFSLQQVYGDSFFHYDFYRMEFEEIANLGLIDEFEKEGLHFVEWGGDKLRELLLGAGFKLFCISIEQKGDKREYVLEVLNA